MYKFARIFSGVLFVFLLSSTAFSEVFRVSTGADSNDGVCNDADCSLREAINAANAAPTDDVIVFFDFVTTMTLSLGEIVIANNGSLVINGDASPRRTVDGNNSGRIITNGVGAVTTISGLRFTRGTGVGATDTGRGGAIYNSGGTLRLENVIVTANAAANGGGLNNAASGSTVATLTLNRCIVSNNTATGSGGGMQNFSTSTVTISNSTFMGNTSNGTTGGGGGQFNGGVRITNSTFANNSAPTGAGGGIQSNGTLGTILTNVTISGNSSANNGGGIHRGTTNVNFFIRNSIVAGNNGAATSPDVTNSANGINSQGNNIIGTVGTSTGWITSDLLNTNPMLGALAENGSFLMNFLPMTGSPAINAGQNCVLDLTCSANNPPVAVTTDQRGIVRPQGVTVDIGAVEVAQAAATSTVGGRVVSPSGQPVPNVIVTISDGSGFVQTTRTTSFGYFTFTGIPNVQNFTINVSSKRFAFTPQTISVNGDTTGIIITASGENFVEQAK